MTYDRGSGEYRDGKPVTRESRHQVVTNEAWPFRDDKGRHARGIKDQPADNQRPVTVRLELDRDGEVFLPGRATRWNATHVYVILDDDRVPRRAVWVKASDVRARPASQSDATA